MDNTAGMTGSPGPERTRLPVASVHETMRADFQAALEEGAATPAVMQFRFADLPVQMRAADPDLLWAVSTAFRHLVEREDHQMPPILTIDLWRAGPESDPPVERPTGRESPRYFLMQTPEYDGSLDMQMGHLAIRVHQLNNGFLAHPFRRMLWRWFRAQEIYPLQGAMVARNGHGLLMMGERGSGRSSAVLECLASGWQFLADSQGGLSRSGKTFTAYSLFSGIEMDPPHAASYRDWRPYTRTARLAGSTDETQHSDAGTEERALLEVADAMPESLLEKVRIDAIAVLVDDPECSRSSTGRLARRAALSAMSSDGRGLDRATLTNARPDYIALAEHCPCFVVMRRCTSDPIVPLLDEIMAQVTSGES